MFQFFNRVFDFGGAVGTVQIFQYKGLFHGYLRYHFNHCLIVYMLSYNIKSGDCQSFRKNLTRKVLINQFNGDISDSGTAKVINRLNFDPARFGDDF